MKYVCGLASRLLLHLSCLCPRHNPCPERRLAKGVERGGRILETGQAQGLPADVIAMGTQ
jgi:hypothetical protein